MSRTAIFIDGAYLDKVCHHEFGGARLNFGGFSARLAAGEEVLRTYYYDCPPYQSNPPTEDERRRYAAKDRFFNALKQLPRYQVRHGKLAYRGTDERGNPIFVQKRIDIMIGVDMVQLAATRQINRAILVAGDSDFVPAIDEVKRHGVLTCLYHGQNSHRELWEACDERIEINRTLVDAVRREPPP